MFNPATLTDDDLRAAIAEARQRLPHNDVCEHCSQAATEEADAIARYQRYVSDLLHHAAPGGYLIAPNNKIVHRWDCTSMKTYQERLVEETTADYYAENLRGGGTLPWPSPVSEDEAKAFVGSSKQRRGCKTCCPDL